MSLFENLVIGIFLVSIFSHGDAFADNSTGVLNGEPLQHKVYIFQDILPFSDKVPPLPWLGHWLYGDSPEAEAVFFRAEDEQYATWAQWMKVLQNSEWEKRMQDGHAQKGKDTVDHSAEHMKFFKISAMRQRYAAYKALLSDDSAPDEEKGLELLKAVMRFGEAIQNNSISLSTGDHPQISSSAAHTIRNLSIKCFAHTIYDPYASKIKQFLSFLPSPMLFNTDIISKALHEQKKLQHIVATFYEKMSNRSTNTKPSHNRDETQKETVQLMQHIADALLRSQDAVQAIRTLSLPLYSLAVPQVNYELERVKSLLVKNDGANQAQEAQIKYLTKKLSRLKNWSNDLVESYNLISKFNLKGKLTKESGRSEKGPEQVLMISLALISAYRLGCRADLPAFEVLPSSTTGILTRVVGLVSSDIPWNLPTIVRSVLFLGGVLYLLIGVKWWALKIAIQSAPSHQGANRGRSRKNIVCRFLFISLNTGEVWVPLMLLFFMCTMWKVNATISPMLLAACIRPSQRVVVCFMFFCILGLFKALCVGVNMLPNLIGKPPLHSYAKKKKI